MDTPVKENVSEWTEVLLPDRGWLDFRLGELWRYRDLILRFFRRDFVASYKQTVLGPLWFVIPPVMTTLIFTVVFGRIGRISTNGQPTFLFFMLGVTAWNYFGTCLSKSALTFSGNTGIFGKVYFPRLILPLATILNNLLTFAIQFGVFLVLFGFYWWQGADVHPNWRVIILPILLVQMAALGLGIGCIVCALTTRFRDFAYMISFGTQLWMYASCVVYPLSTISPEYRWIFILNPMVPIIEALRFSFLGGGMVEIWQLAISAGVTAVLLFVGLVMFTRAEKTFMDTV
ncbi:MAG: ABC transporter permease [Chthoniobacter sp.]|uniref:ABC transporter permease n=1 Tax=Chthoniobacter sp. TaxID=2510640 RepID=UPI0032A19E27